MMKWFAYIVLLLIFAPYLSSAVTKPGPNDLIYDYEVRLFVYANNLKDTVINKKRPQEDDDKNKIKEVSKAKRQAKPEKLDQATTDAKPKPKREQRPAGMERPPEIPRRNGN